MAAETLETPAWLMARVFRHFPGVGVAGIPRGRRWGRQWRAVL
jgi:hypothetical protein